MIRCLNLIFPGSLQDQSPRFLRSAVLTGTWVRCVAICLLWQAVAVKSGLADSTFELRDGDRVVFLGSEFTEQATKYNFVEAALTSRWPERKITFRNLGWAGDDPTAVARGYFGGAKEGYQRLQDELTRLKPTVIFVEYGANAAYDGPDGIPEFKAELLRLLGDLRKLTDRIYLVSPPPAEKLPAPLPDPGRINANRKAVTAALKVLAAEEKLGFIDLMTPLASEFSENHQQPFTDDTIRLNARGYAAAAEVTLHALSITGFSRDGTNAELRELIRAKNDLYFHEYRPQNETYLRGFRKREQGQNAKEIAEFEPLIEAAEARIRAFVQGKPLPPAIEEPGPKELDFKALTPEQQREKFTLAPGLEIQAFAAEPMVANPINMNFDSRGRLWVATSPIYPQIRPGARPTDQIVVLEDTDGDNVADKKTVFVDNLLIPTAVIPDEQGGAYVANSTEIVHLMDKDGDGRADAREVILSGFGTEDTHHILHTFRWSPDALLCFNQSIYIHSHVETPYGVKVMLGSGIWRYQPQTARATTVMFGLWNPWGHVFNNWGQGFATDGAGGEGINYVFPGAAYATAVGFDRVMTGMNPGQPKLCGLEMLTGRHFTEDYQNTLVSADFRGNRVTRFRLTEEGSGYLSRQQPDFLSCSDRAFRPVDLKMAADGSLFIADWHNPIINHGEVDFRDPRRDDRHGRIWRVTMSGRALAPRPQLTKANVDQLLQMLTLPEQWTRIMARVQLRLRDQNEVAEKVKTWAGNLDPHAGNYQQLRLEALWVQQSIGRVDSDLLDAVLKSSDHHARAAAVRVLSQSTQEAFGLPADTQLLPRLQAAVEDPHPQVRLEAVNALREVKQPESAGIALKALDQKMDQWLDFALWSTVKHLEPQWSPLLFNETADFYGDIPKMLFALKALDDASAVPPLMKLLTSDKIPKDRLPAALEIIGKFAGEDDARVLFDRAESKPAERNELLSALVSVSTKRKLVPTGDLSSLSKLFDDPQALQLAGLWNVDSLKSKLVEVAKDEQAAQPRRLGAIQGLTAFKDNAVLKQLASENHGLFAVRRQAIAGLLTTAPNQAATIVADWLTSAGEKDQATASALLDTVLAEKSGPGLLVKALKDKKINPEIAVATVRQASSAGARGDALAAVLREAGGMDPAPKTMSPQEIRKLEVLVRAQGDPLRGEQVYLRKELTCTTCHSIGGAGGLAGPDLLSLGASSPVDYIIQSLITPSAKIKENYHTVTIATVEGKVINGIMVREGSDEVIVRTAKNEEVKILKSDIDDQVLSPTSLMPNDLTAKLSRNELVDLIAFLSSLGKEGEFKVPQNRYVRKWMNASNEVLYSRVDGSLKLPNDVVQKLTFAIDVTTPGRVALKVNDWQGVQFFRDQDNNLGVRDNTFLVDLPAGRQTLQVFVAQNRRQPLKVELVDSPQANGRAELLNH